MTTHRELFDAFLAGESQPRTASNMRTYQDDDGARMVLVSGRSADCPGAVIAVREPLDRVILVQSWRSVSPGAWSEVSTITRTTRSHYRQFRRYARRNHNEELIAEREAIDGVEEPNPEDVISQL